MKITLLTLFLLVVNLSAYNQKTILGTVVNTDNDPISQVKIQREASSDFFYSDLNGEFILDEVKENDNLFLTHLSYTSKKIELSPFFSTSNSDTITIEIILNKRNTLLDSVVVHSKNIQSVCVKKDISVMNYSFLDENILILFKERMRYKMRLVAGNGKLLFEHAVNFKPKELITDCMGNLHLIGKDSCYEIIDIRTPSYNIYSKADFDAFLAPCVASTPSHFYFSSYTDYNQSVAYISTNKTSQERVLLKKVTDEVAINVARDYEVDIHSDPHPHTIEASTATMKGARKKLQKVFWFQTNLTRQTYHPLIPLNDSLYLFDHLNNTCYVYDEKGKLNREFSFNYPNLENWRPKLISDSFHNKIYALTETEGMISLHLINLQSGEIDHSYPLKEHSFPIDIQVKADFVYYIHATSSGFYKLYRQRLKK